MKKYFAFMLLFVLLLTACGAQKHETADTAQMDSAEETTDVADAAMTESAEETTASADISKEKTVEESTAPADAAKAESAEETAASADAVNPAEPVVNLDDFVGHYVDGDYDEVIIEKNGNDYTMEVGLTGLTTLDEGTVSASNEGVVFHTIDAAGNPMTVSFYQDGDDHYALRVDESTWELLEQGTIFDEMIKTS